MDIKDILNNLGLDFSDPEIKRGALEAIDAILDSRVPPPSFGGNIGGNGGGNSDTEEVEIDPDLLQPSKKYQPPVTADDIEIEDEDHILDQVKHNKSDDDFSNDSAGNEQDTASQSSGIDNSSESQADSTEKDGDNTATDENSFSDSDEDSTDKVNNTKDSLEDPEDVSGSGEGHNGDGEDFSSEQVADEEDMLPDEEELDFDEENLLDDTLKDTFEDEGVKTKQEARKIKRERTLQAARAALSTAKAEKKSLTLIRELESAISALEALTEAVKSIKDISDDEFNRLVNRVFDAIDALGGGGLTYTTDEERELVAKEIKADLSSTTTQQELSAEDIAQIRAENQAIQARDKEAGKYKARARSSFKGFQDFLNNLYRAIALQVQVDEVQDDSWSAINRRHSGNGVLQPGKRLSELPNRKIPVIDFYFDCSGSWTENDIKVGKKAIKALADMEEKGQIKINLYYFGDEVSSVYTDVAGGGTWAWNEIVKNVISTQATNVIIMTDSDMEDRWNGDKALSYTVPGYVWYLWRNGENAPRLPRDLKGRGGTQQFSFSTSDA